MKRNFNILTPFHGYMLQNSVVMRIGSTDCLKEDQIRLTQKLCCIFLWRVVNGLPAPGCLVRRRSVNRNTGGVNDGRLVHRVAEAAVWVQHAFVTVTAQQKESQSREHRQLALTPLHFPLCCAVRLGTSLGRGRWHVLRQVTLGRFSSIFHGSSVRSHSEMEAACSWDARCCLVAACTGEP